MIKLRAPTASGSVNVGGREVKIEDGHVEVDAAAAAVLKESHGFVDPGAPPAANPAAADSNRCSLSRAVVLDALKSLGIVVPLGRPDDKLEMVLAEGARRQGERVEHEIKAAERRGEDKAIALIREAEQAPKGEQTPKAGEVPGSAKAAPAAG